MHIVYPLLWSRLHPEASRVQAISTAAALARHGAAVTLLMPRGRDDGALTARELCDYYQVEGDLRLVQRPSRWAGQKLVTSAMWLRQLFGDPLLAEADLLYSRIPAMLGVGQLSPLPFATEQYRRWPDELPVLRPLFRRTAAHDKCLGLILHSQLAADSYRRAGVAGERLLVAHNGFDPSRIDPECTKEMARAALGLAPHRPIAVYAGRIDADKAIDQLLALAALRPDTLFLLVGALGGPFEAGIDGRSENVRLIPWQDPASVPRWLLAADVLLVPPSRQPLELFGNCVLPMKLFAYLAAGRPILAPDTPDVAELLTHEDTAMLVEPDRPEAAAAALDRLLGDAALATRLEAKGRILSRSLTWDARAATIADFLQRRLAQRSQYSSTVVPVSPTISGAAQAPTAGAK